MTIKNLLKYLKFFKEKTLSLGNLLKFTDHSTKNEVLFFIQLQQDLDILLPIIHLLEGQFHIVVLTTREVAEESPRILKILNHNGITPIIREKLFITKLQNFPNAHKTLALFSASESNQNPHRAAYKLAKLANQKDIISINVQHGLENIGLTYFDDRYDNTVLFASQKILIWPDTKELPKEVSYKTKSKCITVGCPKIWKTVDSSQHPTLPIPLGFIAIFENLHWHRYSDSYRQSFLQSLYATIESYPEQQFLIKPHHAGKWITSRYKGDVRKFDNLIIADPDDSLWEPYTAQSIIEGALAVITTPSTVALDGAAANKATAIIGNDLPDLSIYKPLVILKNESSWLEFCKKPTNEDSLKNSLRFARRYMNEITDNDLVKLLEFERPINN